MQGYYWPEKGPQNTMYIPGPLLKACNNELILLEVGAKMRANASPKGACTAAMLKPQICQSFSRICLYQTSSVTSDWALGVE